MGHMLKNILLYLRTSCSIDISRKYVTYLSIPHRPTKVGTWRPSMPGDRCKIFYRDHLTIFKDYTWLMMMAWCNEQTFWKPTSVQMDKIRRFAKKLDESTARRQLKSPRSLSGRSIHLTLVTKWSWSWSWMTYCHPLCAMSIDPPILGYGYFKIWPWKSMVKPGVQSICLLFVSWQLDHFCLRYRKFYIWPWKFKVKFMAKVKPNGHISALEFNRYVCFSFRGNRTIFGWDIANSIFDLEKSSSRSWRKSTKI